MVQTALAYLLVAVAAAWTLRRFWPRRRPAPLQTAPKTSESCDNCDCGR